MRKIVMARVTEKTPSCLSEFGALSWPLPAAASSLSQVGGDDSSASSKQSADWPRFTERKRMSVLVFSSREKEGCQVAKQKVTC